MVLVLVLETVELDFAQPSQAHEFFMLVAVGALVLRVVQAHRLQVVPVELARQTLCRLVLHRLTQAAAVAEAQVLAVPVVLLSVALVPWEMAATRL